MVRFLVLVVFVACGAPQTGSSSGDCFAIVPMTLVALEHGREWEPIAELRADGTIVRERNVIATLSADRLVKKTGETILTCGAGRRITIDGRSLAHFDGNERMIDADGSPLFVDPDGAVHWIRKDGDLFDGARFEGGFARARRSAAAVVLATLATANWTAH